MLQIKMVSVAQKKLSDKLLKKEEKKFTRRKL